MYDMKKLFLILLLGLSFLSVSAQIVRPDKNNGLFKSDSTKFKDEVKIKLSGETSYKDYKIFNINNDTTVVDTTLTLNKDFKFNYLRKDNFELLPFHNQGQTYNKLGYSFQNNSIFPQIGMNAKQFNYYKAEDINYYYVPTPTTELMYRTGLEQGQVLDALITMNTSRQLNFSLAYKGLRSLGKYRNTLASHGNFRATFNYHSINKNYDLKGHFSSHDLLNNENGGLTEESINYFENNDPNYIDRGRLEVNFTEGENLFEGKRYFIDQSLIIVSNQEKPKKKKRKKKGEKSEIEGLKIDSLATIDSTLVAKPSIEKDSIIASKEILKTEALVKKDTLTNIIIAQTDSLTKTETIQDSIKIIEKIKKPLFNIKIGHSLLYETTHYRFKQETSTDYFGDSYTNAIIDHTSYQKMNNELYLELNTSAVGKLKAKANYFNYNYHYNSILYFNDYTISDKLKGNSVAVGAEWKTHYGKFHLNADAASIISGDLNGNSIKAAVMFKKDSVYNFKGFAEITSKTPQLNTLLYQSDYKNYNWQNNFKNEEIKNVGVEFKINKYGSVFASYNLIDNYTYFDENSKPTQASETLNYLKVKVNQYFTFRKFTIDNTVMYQKVSKGDSFFRVPELVTRNTLYYSNYLFKKKPLYLQTGVTFKYFTAFKSNAYNPLISEFVLQNETEIGNYPILDFFVNAQVQRTRIFLKVENLNASFTGRNYYSAPNYPYRDLTVRFGLVWNFFI